MRTRKARRLRRQGLIRCRVGGHRPALISATGALAVYGCLNHNCLSLFEVWDNPDHIAGQMYHSTCVDTKITWWRKLLLKMLPF